MAKKKKSERTFEFRTSVDGNNIAAAPAVRNAELDQLLESHSAESFVFIPLARPAKKQKSIAKAATKARRKAELTADEWHDGELRDSDCEFAIPGVFGFNVRRRKAREIAEKIGVKLFFWGTANAPVEQHAVSLSKDDETYEWKVIKRRAFSGLVDLFDTARSIKELPTAVQESQTTMPRFWQLVYVVLGVSLAAGLLHGLATSLLGTVASLAFYPVVIPAVFVGIYLRVLSRKGEAQARDFTAAEAVENWHKVAPHLLALWALCFTAVTLLTWLQSVPETDFPFLGRTSGVTTSFIICVWMLLPIANSRDISTLFSSALEAGIAAAVSIFMIRLFLYITNLITDTLWEVLGAVLPFDIPERLMQVINFFVDIGAEVFFLAILLGYAWSRTRQQFMRL